MKKYVYTTLALLAFSAGAFAQDLRKVRQTFFPAPQGLELHTPLAGKRSGYTSHKEMKQFVRALAQRHPHMVSVQTVGHTQKGREIELVKLSVQGGEQDKLRLLYLGSVHGDEPGGIEGLLHFMERMTAEPGLQQLLQKMEFYIIPIVNADGADRMVRQTANGVDLNRDQVRLETPEAKAMREAVNRVAPHVCIDFHEYGPLKSAYNELSTEVLTVPWDVMFLSSGNPNVSPSLRQAVDNLFLPQASRQLQEQGFTSHTYYTPRRGSKGVVMNMGGASPRSTSNSFALSGTFSILIEGRGIGLGRKGIHRRLQQVRLLSESFARTCYDHKEQLQQALKEAEQDRRPVAIEFSSKKVKDFSMPFINELKNRIDTLQVDVSDAMASKVKEERALPESYMLLPTETYAAQTLRRMGVQVDTLQQELEVEVEALSVTAASEGQQVFRTFIPLDVETKVRRKTVRFPKGSFVVNTRQKHVRLLAVMLEPESSNGFVNYRVIAAEKGRELPVYRCMQATEPSI